MQKFVLVKSQNKFLRTVNKKKAKVAQINWPQFKKHQMENLRNLVHRNLQRKIN